MNHFKLAIFDMDGTIFESHLDWHQIRSQLRIQPGDSILDTIYRDQIVDHERLTLLEQYEHQNTMKIGPIDGVAQFIDKLKQNQVTVTLVTNNNRKNTFYLLEKYNLYFHRVITRESRLWKPGPEAFHLLMKDYQIPSTQTMAIGDSHYDVIAARDAGISNIYIIKNHHQLQHIDHNVVYFDDYHHLQELMNQNN